MIKTSKMFSNVRVMQRLLGKKVFSQSIRLRDISGSRYLTWSRMCVLRDRRSCLHTTAVSSTRDKGILPGQWDTPLALKDPEYSLEYLTYLLDPQNYEAIKQDISHRKGVGDIDLLIKLVKEKDCLHPEKLKSLLTTATKKQEKSETELTEEDLRVKAIVSTIGDIPNTSHPQSPKGDEEMARLLNMVGEKRDFDFTPKTVVELGEALGMLRLNNMRLTTGPGTYYFTDKLAMLEQALIRYTVDYLIQKGFELVSVPDLLDPAVIDRCGFKTTGPVTQVYKLDPSRHKNLCLAGTSEMALAGFFINKKFESQQELPVKLASISRCYRAETSGLEIESGIYRVHQFTKVEMFGVTSSEADDQGSQLLTEFMDIEQELFSQLGLHFRILDMPTEELGAPAHRKFDIETWMPAKQFWGEISSASNCTDYQSMRLNIKYINTNGDAKHCTTVNGTACAVPRTLMAICEHFQQKDGSIALPRVLWPYMDGLQTITRPDHQPNMSYIHNIKPYRQRKDEKLKTYCHRHSEDDRIGQGGES